LALGSHSNTSSTAGTSGQRPISLGWIPYWNLVPLKSELQRGLGSGVEFHNGHPTVVNRWLADGVVGFAPSSSICLVRNPSQDIALPLGVAADGPVHSVYIGLGHRFGEFQELVRERSQMLGDLCRRALVAHAGDLRKVAQMVWDESQLLPPVSPAAVPPLALSTASATSVGLVRLLYRLWFGESTADRALGARAGVATRPAGLPADVLEDLHPAELVIGDEALLRRGAFAHTIDLGQVWRDMTGLPFVFAVWQSNGTAAVSSGVRKAILDAAELASARMRIEPAVYIPDVPVLGEAGSVLDLPAYWRAIQYRLTTRHLAGLCLFLSLVRLHCPNGHDDEILVKIARWQELGARHSI